MNLITVLVIQWLPLQLWTWSLFDAMPSTDNTKKVIVIGDGYCGKTTLVAKITGKVHPTSLWEVSRRANKPGSYAPGFLCLVCHKLSSGGDK